MSENIQVGNIRMEFLRNKHDTGGSLDLMRMTVPPAGQMPVAHYHRDWDETVYGLEGTITFKVDGAEHAVGPGDTLFIKRGIVHGFDNRSGADAICLVALTPGVLGRPGVFPQIGRVSSRGPLWAQARANCTAKVVLPTPPLCVADCKYHRQWLPSSRPRTVL